MNKAQKKNLFQAIEKGKIKAIDAILATEPDALEAFGEHNNYVRDKTPLMYALQCANFELAHHLLDRGANAAAVMAGGPKETALQLLVYFSFCDSSRHLQWVRLAKRFLDGGADPTPALRTAVFSIGSLVRRTDMVELLLARGADPHHRIPALNGTIKDIVKWNQTRKPRKLLELFGVDSPPPQPKPRRRSGPPFLEHPDGSHKLARSALIEGMRRLDKLKIVRRWMLIDAQGRGSTDETYDCRSVAYRKGVLDIKPSAGEFKKILKATGFTAERIPLDADGRIVLSELSPQERGEFLDELFLKYYRIKRTRRGRDYAVGFEWIKSADRATEL